MAITPPAILARPFADSGDKVNIPDTTGTAGAASLTEGFPPVTQLPLSAGGIPPRRLDFNGVLNILSQFSFWAQSGGQFSWNSALDYAPPCMVFGSNGKIYFGLAPSGPGYSGVGAKNPVTAANQGTYWVSLTGYALEPATKTKLGGIKVGDGFTITADGKLSVDPKSFSTDLITELMKQLRLPQWITANRTWYVRPDGNDSNDGSANTAAGAFKTIQAAVNYISENFNFGRYRGTLHIASGVYNEYVTLPKYNGSTGSLQIQGESAHSVSLVGGIRAVISAGRYAVSGISITNTGAPQAGATSEYLLNIPSGVDITLHSMNLYATTPLTTAQGLYIFFAEGSLATGEDITVTMADDADVLSVFYGTGGSLTQGRTMTVNGALHGPFLRLNGLGRFQRGSNAELYPVFNGNVSGSASSKYRVNENSICFVRNGGVNYFPGVGAGSVASGGQYI